MFITATKIAVVEAIRSGFNAIGPASNNNTIDLVPRSVTIEYPVEEIEWPAIYVQFRPTTTQYTGLAPDIETQNQDGTWNSYRHGYFEGAFDLQILAMSSEERDRIWDTLTNLIMMGNMAPGASSFYQSILDDQLIGLTILPGQVAQVGDTVNAGTPWSSEELTYEATVRVRCVGEFYEDKYNQTLLPLDHITVVGQATYENEILNTQTYTYSSNL